MRMGCLSMIVSRYIQETNRAKLAHAGNNSTSIAYSFRGNSADRKKKSKTLHSFERKVQCINSLLLHRPTARFLFHFELTFL